MKQADLLKKIIKNFPTQCGVYLMKDTNSHVIYVGKAGNLKSRIQSYFSNDKSFKNTFLVPKVQYIDYILTDTEVEAYLLEANLVKKHNPRYNIRLKDDKSYPYIRCSIKEPFPRFYMERRVKKKGSLYFGPYTTAGFVRQMIQLLNTRFKIRDCSNHFMKGRTKPCLTYHIGACTAPCVRKVSQPEYLQQIKQSVSFLRGKGKAVLKNMEKQMKQLSKEERFEEAARLRDNIKAVEFCRAKQTIVSRQNKNLDVMAFHSDKKAILFQTLHIRAGAVVGHRFYYKPNIMTDRTVFEKKPGNQKTLCKASSSLTNFSEQFCSFIIQYYMDNLLPDSILLNRKQIDSSLFSTLEKALLKIQGKTACVREPGGSVEKKLMDMALKNAHIRFTEQYSKKQSLLKGLEDIQKKFHLKNLPERMECFDISHFQGQSQVASQVVFEEGIPKKEDYRKYKIKTVEGVDDFAGIKEVLDRRFRHEEYPDPHLLIVDGGKGQLNKALLALKSAGRKDVPVVAIAKSRVKSDFSSSKVQSNQERFFLPGRKNAIVFKPDSEALNILVHLRDEAHRFAVAYHRRLSQKSLFSQP